MQRDALGLTLQQVGQLEEIDRQLARDNAAARAELPGSAEHEHGSATQPGGPGADGGPGRDGLDDGDGSTGGAGYGRRWAAGGAHGGRSGGHRRGSSRHGREGDSEAPDRGKQLDAALEAMDENDAAAYLKAEAFLTQAQREKARELASQYREQLWNWRQSRHGARGHDGSHK